MSLLALFLRRCALVFAVISLVGCASVYVDGNAPEVPVASLKKPNAPSDVQLVWEFQTRRVANARATELLKVRVREQIAASGLFASVKETPVPNGALLAVTVNNVPLTDDAAKKGFIAGLTFGIAGQTVGDGYECTMRYSKAAGQAALVHAGKHVIYASFGNSDPPAGAQKMANLNDAVTVMLKQLLSRTLADLAADRAFP